MIKTPPPSHFLIMHAVIFAAVAAHAVEPSVYVETSKVAKGTLSDFEFGQGTVRAKKRQYLVFEDAGRITYIKQIAGRRIIREGDPVYGPGDGRPQGELLAQLDRKANDAALKSAEATLASSRAQLKATKKEYERAKKLVASGAIGRSRFDSAEATYKKALGEVKVARAQLEHEKVNLRNRQLLAPFDGKVAFINIRKGQYASPQEFDASNEHTAARTAPIVVIDPSSFEIIVDLPQYSGRRVKVGQSALLLDEETLAGLQIGAFAGDVNSEFERKLIPGKVISVSPAVNPEDRSIRVRVAAEGGKHNLLDGGFITVLIEVAHRQGITLLPLQALKRTSGGNVAYVVNDGAVEQRNLMLGQFGLEGYEVLEGVSEGDWVVTKGIDRIRHGQKNVKVVNSGE